MIDLFKRTFAKFFLVVIFSVFLTLFLSHPAFAVTFQLSGTVADNSGNPISAAVSALDPSTNNTISSTNTDPSGHYILILDQGTYNIQVMPDSDTGFSSATALNQNINSNKILDFRLVAAGTVTLTGHVYNPAGNPLQGQMVQLGPSGTIAQTETDASGFYSLQATAGDYTFAVEATGITNGIHYTHSFRTTSNLSLNHSLILDITLPFKRVDMHVQDSSGNPIPNVIISSNAPTNSFLVGTIQFTGRSQANNIVTNTNGDVSVWLYASPMGQPYVFTATPPANSNFTTTTLGDISVQSDMTVNITLNSTTVTLSRRNKIK